MSKKKTLRPFQRRVRDLVRQGKNVLLQAPTGSGKTRAALSPYADNLWDGEGNALPLKCLYATPMRVLTNHFYNEYEDVIAHIDKKKGTDYTRQYARLGREPVSIQTGEQPDDPQFEALLTFCTIDQLLASFLGTPYGLGKRLANINVGAVVGSYIVLDEFHLYPLVDEESLYGARTTTLAMLSLLKGITPFVLMTATFSTKLLEQLAQLLDAKIVQIDEHDEEELQEITQGRVRWFEVSDRSLSAEAILARHEQCSLVVCNTVARAQQYYWDLSAQAHARGIELVLLHSRLTDQDRSKRSKDVLTQLGPAPDEYADTMPPYGWKDGRYYGKNIIVVATQVVEVGLDISVQHLHTEIAPANSMVQRAGRCARFAQQQGHVIVYDLPAPEEGKQTSYLPYPKDLCLSTLTTLRAMDLQQPFGFVQEQYLIDAVHTAGDMELLMRFRNRRKEIEKAIFANLQTHSSSVVSTLIRNVAQVHVLVHAEPNQGLRIRPWQYQSFSLHPATLAAALARFETIRGQLDLKWICKKALPDPEVEHADEDMDTRQPTPYTWSDISFSQDQKRVQKELREAFLLVLPPQLATYHPELGFLLFDLGSAVDWKHYQSELLQAYKGRQNSFAPYVVQGYLQHIKGLRDAYNAGIAAQLRYTVGKLEQRLSLPTGSVDHALRLAIACHDLGKLSVRWQEWARAWQKRLYAEQYGRSYVQQESFFFAKTDFDHSPEHRRLQGDLKEKRPHHACESVVLASALIAHSLGIDAQDHPSIPLFRAVLGTIARHHTPLASEYEDMQLKDGAQVAIEEALECVHQGQTWSYDSSLVPSGSFKKRKLVADNGDSPYLTRPMQGDQESLETWLYFLIVRAPRLADQRADDFSQE